MLTPPRLPLSLPPRTAGTGRARHGMENQVAQDEPKHVPTAVVPPRPVWTTSSHHLGVERSCTESVLGGIGAAVDPRPRFPADPWLTSGCGHVTMNGLCHSQCKRLRGGAAPPCPPSLSSHWGCGGGEARVPSSLPGGSRPCPTAPARLGTVHLGVLSVMLLGLLSPRNRYLGMVTVLTSQNSVEITLLSARHVGTPSVLPATGSAPEREPLATCHDTHRETSCFAQIQTRCC